MSGWHIRDESQHRTALMHCCRDWPDSGGLQHNAQNKPCQGRGIQHLALLKRTFLMVLAPVWLVRPGQMSWDEARIDIHIKTTTHTKRKRKRKKKTSTALPDFAWIELHQNILLIPHTWSRSLAKLVINAPPAQPKCSVGSGQRGLWRCGWCFTETVVTKDVFSLTVVRLVSKNSSLVVAATAVGEVTTLWLADLAIYILLSDCQQTQVQVQTDHQDS